MNTQITTKKPRSTWDLFRTSIDSDVARISQGRGEVHSTFQSSQAKKFLTSNITTVTSSSTFYYITSSVHSRTSYPPPQLLNQFAQIPRPVQPEYVVPHGRTNEKWKRTNRKTSCAHRKQLLEIHLNSGKLSHYTPGPCILLLLRLKQPPMPRHWSQLQLPALLPERRWRDPCKTSAITKTYASINIIDHCNPMYKNSKVKFC